jgi:hypothetical protein
MKKIKLYETIILPRSVYMQNVVCHIKGRTQFEDIRQQGP